MNCNDWYGTPDILKLWPMTLKFVHVPWVPSHPDIDPYQEVHPYIPIVPYTPPDICPYDICPQPMLGTGKMEVESNEDKADEKVDHPAHYTIGGIEAIDVIEAWDLGFCLGNLVKYVARAGIKDVDTEIEDLEKARWYLDRHIENLKKERNG